MIINYSFFGVFFSMHEIISENSRREEKWTEKRGNRKKEKENEKENRAAYFFSTSFAGFISFQASSKSCSRAEAKNGVLTQMPTS